MAVIEERNNANLLRSTIFSRLLYKLKYSNKKGGQNLLGIDLLKKEVKSDLLTLTTVKLENTFKELTEQKYGENFFKQNATILFITLIVEISEDFLYKQYGCKIKVNRKKLKNTLYTRQLLKDLEILFQIPFYVLYNKKAPQFRSVYYPIYTSANEQFIEALLDNLIIEISNCVAYFIILNFSYIYLFRQTIYRSKYLSLRNLERFKNNLIWQVRLKFYIQTPTDLYDNCYRIYILRANGIANRLIYANRTKQIRSLTNIPLTIIAFIELKDFLICRLDETIYFLSSGLRFVLTNVIGQIIGLIWRGVIEGLKR